MRKCFYKFQQTAVLAAGPMNAIRLTLQSSMPRSVLEQGESQLPFLITFFQSTYSLTLFFKLSNAEPGQYIDGDRFKISGVVRMDMSAV